MNIDDTLIDLIQAGVDLANSVLFDAQRDGIVSERTGKLRAEFAERHDLLKYELNKVLGSKDGSGGDIIQ